MTVKIRFPLLRDPMLVLIIIIALIISLININSRFTFGGDQAKDLLRILEITKGDLALIGPQIGRTATSSFYIGPFYYYLMIPFLFLTKMDPVGMIIPIIFAKLVTIFLTYTIANRLFSKRIAIFSSLIAAFSDYWTDKLGFPSEPYLIVSITLAVIYFLLKISEEKNEKIKKIYLILIGLLIGLNTHLHYFGLSIVPSILVFIYLGKQRLKSIVLICIGFIIAILPLILFEIKNKFFLTAQILKLFSQGYVSQNGINIFEKINSTLNFFTVYTFAHKFPNFISIPLLFFGFYLFIKKSKILYSGLVKILLITCALNFLGVIVYFNKEQPHYLAPSMPFMFLTTALVIDSTKKLFKFFPSILLVFICTLLLLKSDLLRNNGYTMPEDLSIGEIRSISKIIASNTNGETFNVTSTLDGDSRALAYRYLLKLYGESPQDPEHYDNVDSLFVVTRDPNSSVRENNLFEISSFQPSYVADTWYVNGDIKLIKLTKKIAKVFQIPTFVTIVNPLRSRQFWTAPTIDILTSQINAIKQRNLESTWLIAYDNLYDVEVVNLLKSLNPQSQQMGILLEVSQKLATDSNVGYKVADGDYYRPDKVFLSGYAQTEREKIITTFVKKFKEVFNSSPASVGAWYIDPYSLNLLSKLKINSAVTLSDQFDTDAARVWGQYFAYPYYPSKFNSLEPANSQKNKVPIVKIQWAQRDPVLSYGKSVKESRESFQSNDYINNDKSFNFFVDLFNLYRTNTNTPFNQITIGLEAGQEGATFINEFEKQLDFIKQLKNENKIEVVTTSQFANWYEQNFNGLSPSHILKKEDSFWYMSPHLRVGIFKEENQFQVKDLRSYNNLPSKDYFYQDDEKFLDRTTKAAVDQLSLNNQVGLDDLNYYRIQEKFDKLIIETQGESVLIDKNGIKQGTKQILASANVSQNNSKIILVQNLISFVKKIGYNLTSPFLFSNINGERIFALKLSPTKVFAIYGNKVGLYVFDFQTVSKFQSPSSLVKNWQPWTAN